MRNIKFKLNMQKHNRAAVRNRMAALLLFDKKRQVRRGLIICPPKESALCCERRARQ